LSHIAFVPQRGQPVKRSGSYFNRLITLVFGILALVLLGGGAVVHLLTEGWWYSAMGYGEVFWTLFTWGSFTWLGTFTVYFVALWGNCRIAMAVTRTLPFDFLEGTDLQRYISHYFQIITLLVIGIISFLAATYQQENWEILLKAAKASDFAITEPIFEKDVGFYVFWLPLFEAIHAWVLILILCCLGIAVTLYLLKGAISFSKLQQGVIHQGVKGHLTILLIFLIILAAVGFGLARYNLLYSTEGLIYGASYTDVYARENANEIMIWVSGAFALFLLISLRRRSLILPGFSLGVYLIVLTITTGIYPWFVQQFIVEPNELAKETPFIENNIAFTRNAYDLDQVTVQQYPATGDLTLADLEDNAATIQNIRIWDNTPLLTTYRQLQEIRLYYRFNDVDVDRYFIDDQYREVMLSARELSFVEAPDRAKTWVNQRLKYTHGYGLVMSPVNEANPDGLPIFFIKNVPPESIPEFKITQPRIYYGEETNQYIFTGTSTTEFDYPLGDENADYRYQGEGGVPIGSWWRRLAYAYDLDSLKILISGYFTPNSKIHYYRNLKERVQKVVPFLKLDNDPYLSLINGRLKWFLDGYTTSEYYPYSEPLSEINKTLKQPVRDPVLKADFNYIRNSVKIIVDAYDGTMDFYVVDPADPILTTYQKIFPNLFQPSSAIPHEIRTHFRYPRNLFKIQSQAYLSYHMEAPQVFYNQEDLWRFPTEIYGESLQQVEPYYMIMRLPSFAETEFVLNLPFTPASRDNMVAWLAARSDNEDYGELILYEFPKQELVYGPAQIEARIDQDPLISEQLTLWSQEGSRVIRGDLIVLPIATSLLYVEPIYLRAEQSELPELTRVIVAYRDRVVMEPSLDLALVTIFGTPRRQIYPEIDAGASVLSQSALDLYQQLQDAAQRGDWSEYGRLNQQLVELLERIEASTPN
jgi:uncharacterized membrane protein (UPF0182 family)